MNPFTLGATGWRTYVLALAGIVAGIKLIVDQQYELGAAQIATSIGLITGRLATKAATDKP